VKKNWDKIDKEIEGEILKHGEEYGEDQSMNFFKQIFAQGDEEKRRAMMKSFQTSGGTVLSTDWNDVAKKDYEGRDRPSPPKGQEWKRREYWWWHQILIRLLWHIYPLWLNKVTIVRLVQCLFKHRDNHWYDMILMIEFRYKSINHPIIYELVEDLSLIKGSQMIKLKIIETTWTLALTFFCP